MMTEERKEELDNMKEELISHMFDSMQEIEEYALLGEDERAYVDNLVFSEIGANTTLAYNPSENAV